MLFLGWEVEQEKGLRGDYWDVGVICSTKGHLTDNIMMQNLGEQGNALRSAAGGVSDGRPAARQCAPTAPFA